MAAQDPLEGFDLVDEHGAPRGVVKPRGEVHRDGDWHRALHLWLLTRAHGAPRVILQRRSREKDTHPGLVDVSVGGHLRAGEGLVETLREADEELGVTVPWSSVTTLGRAWVESRTARYWDREILDVLSAEVSQGLAALRPLEDEVDEVFAVDPWDAWGLWAGRLGAVRALARRSGEPAVRTVSLRADELVAPGDPYRLRALASLLARACGAGEGAWTLRLDRAARGA